MSEQYQQPKFSSPFAKGVKGRGQDNPSFKSNDIFYGRDPAPVCKIVTPKSANRRTNNPVGNNNYINSTPDKLAQKNNFVSPTQNQQQDTVKKQPNYVEENIFTAKKQQQQQSSMLSNNLSNTRIPSNSYINDVTQEQIKPKQQQLYQQQKQSHTRSKTGNIPYPSKYTEVNPDQNRYELPVKQQQQQNYASQQQQQQQPQQEQQQQSQDAKEITFKPSKSERPSTSQQNYLRSYTPQQFVRIDGKLVAQNEYAPSQTARFQKDQQATTPKSLSRAPSQPFVNQNNDDVKSQASRYSKRSNNSQGIKSVLNQQQQQEDQFDRVSVASSNAKSVYSRASCCSKASVGSVYVCDVCYNKALKIQKEEQKRCQKQKDRELHNWRVEQDKIYSQCVQDAQNQLKSELNKDMTDFFKEHPNKLEKLKRDHQDNINTNKKINDYQNELNQRDQQEMRELNKQKKDYIKQVLTEQMQQKQAKKEQEKQDELRYAYNPEYDEMMKRREQQRQTNLTNQMKQELQKQIDIKNERKQKEKERDHQYNQIYKQLQRNAKDSSDKMQKEQDHQKQLYKQMLENAIQNKLDKTQQERVNELTKLRDELKKIEDQNRKIASEVYQRDQQMKQELRDSYKEQIGIKKDREIKEKKDKNYITTLPIQERPKLDTKECNECHTQVILNRLMKYKKAQKK